MKLEACLGGESGFTELRLPEGLESLCPGEPVPGNVGRLYEGLWQELVHDRHDAPDVGAALELHRLIDRIEQAAM